MHEIIIRYIKVGATVLLSGGLVGVLLYKVAASNIGFNASDLSTTEVLSIFLALFSVALAVMFYFKSSEESSQFYNHSYTFTKDISQILGRIEAGFGERLRHLDESYTTVRDRLEGVVAERTKTVEKVKEEEQDVKKTIAERDQMIAQLMERANLGVEEKNAIQQQLAEKEKELDYAKRQLFEYRRRLKEIASTVRTTKPSDPLHSALTELGGLVGSQHFRRAPIGWLTRHIKEHLPRLSAESKSVLQSHGIIDTDGDMTARGYEAIREWNEKTA